jgi:hypothetical protein
MLASSQRASAVRLARPGGTMACGSTQQYRHLLVIIATPTGGLKKITAKIQPIQGDKGAIDLETWRQP